METRYARVEGYRDRARRKLTYGCHTDWNRSRRCP
jgi:hypothetical protein